MPQIYDYTYMNPANPPNTLLQSLEPIAVTADPIMDPSNGEPITPKPGHPKWRPNKTFLLSGLALLVMTTLVFLLILLVSVSRQKEAAVQSPTNQQYPNIEIPLTDLTDGKPLTLGQLSQVDVSGRITVNGTLILAPGEAPAEPVPGELYFSQQSQKVYYYDGTSFNQLASSGENSFSFGGISGQVVLGSGLSLNGNVLNGATSGITVVNGTANQINVIVDGGTATLALPQDIAVSSSPTFAGLQLNGLLNISNGSNVLSAAIGGFKTTLGVTSPTANRLISLPDVDGMLCIQGSADCGFMLSGTSGNYVSFSSATAQEDTTTNNSILINKTNASGNILQLQKGGADVLTLNNDGDLTVQNTTIAAGKTLTVIGGNTASRPAIPSEGMVYFDTDTDKLLMYSNGKWQADRSTATKIVAASNSSQAVKDGADYVVFGNAEDEINSALTAAAGGKVYLAEGTYVAGATILIPNNTTLAGAGRGTLVELADLDAAATLISNSDTTTGTGIVIRDMRLNGRKDLNTIGGQNGIYVYHMGDAPNRVGAQISGIWLENFSSTGVEFHESDINTISNSIITGNNYAGILAGWGSEGNNISSNSIKDNSFIGIFIGISDGTVVSGNTINRNGTGINLGMGNRSVITGNVIIGSTGNGIILDSSTNNTISANQISDSSGVWNNSGIRIFNSSNNNFITNNNISDSACTATCYAIDIGDAVSSNNYLSGNRITGPSAVYPATINDAGTGTTFGNQAITANQVLQSTSSLITASAVGSISGTGGTASNTTLTGTSTQFLSQLQVGDRITVNAETRTIVAIASNTLLTVDTAFTGSGSGYTITRLPAALVVRNIANANLLQFQNSTGALQGGFDASGNLFYRNNGYNLSIQAPALANNQTITFPDASGTVCLTSGNCVGIGGMGDILQNGNNFTAAMTIGTNDNYDLNLETSGVTQLSINSAGTASFSGSLIVAANRSLSLAGGNTASRPASPTEGMIYYDTSTKQLLTYANGKWQADGKTATFIVAASNSSQSAKDSAQYVGNGEIGDGITTVDGDQVEINAAITAANAAGGGIVYLTEGTYYVDAPVLMRSNITLIGTGYSSYIVKATGTTITSAISLNATDGSVDNIKIRDLRASAGNGIATVLLSNSTGMTNNVEIDNVDIAVQGGGWVSKVIETNYITGLRITNSYLGTGENGVDLSNVSTALISNNQFTGATDDNRSALVIYLSSFITVSKNKFNGSTRPFDIRGSSILHISENDIKCDTIGAANYGIVFYTPASSDIIISDNRIEGCSSGGIYFSSGGTSDGLQIDSNHIIGTGAASSYGVILSGVGSANARISNNTIEQTSYGVYIPSGSAVINNNRVSGTTAYGILSNGSQTTINGNNISSTGSAGIYSSGGYSTVNDNNISNSASSGIYTTGSNSTVGGNVISNSATDGIYVGASSNAVISGNTLYNNAGVGASSSLSLNGTNYALISDNRITDTAGTGYAIYIASSSSVKNTLSNNYFSGIGADRIFDASSSTLYVNQASSALTLQTGSTSIKSLAATILTGSIDPTASTVVTGVGTQFLSQIQVGDKIIVSGETRTVVSITSDTVLTVEKPFSDNANDTSVDRLPAALVVINSTGSKTVLAVNPFTNTMEITSAAPPGLVGFSEGFETAVPPSGWTVGGDALWAQDAVTFNGGAASANSGVITDSQTSWIDYDFNIVGGDGELSFDWKVSSEGGYDYLLFCLDNDTCTSTIGYSQRISGEVGWTKVTIPVTEGAHSFRWIYSKDSSVSAGTDEAWIDNVSLPDNIAQDTFVVKNNTGSIDFFGISSAGNSILNGNSLIKSRVDSTAAFQIQNAVGDTVFTADTVNSNVGIGTATPTTTLHVAANNSDVTKPQMLLEQQGDGDSTLEIKSIVGSWFAGIDASDGGSFKINSSTNASSSGTFGYTGVGNNVDTGSGTVLAAGKFTSGVNGTVSALNVHVGGDMDSFPSNQFRLALYMDDGTGNAPGALITESTSTTVSAGWNTVAVPGVAVTTGTIYWIGYGTNATDSSKNNPTLLNSGGTCVWTSAYSYGSMPVTWPGTTGMNGSCQKSVYATVQVAGAYDSYTSELFRLAANGALRLRNSSDSKTAFAVLNAASTKQALAVDTSTGGLGVNLDFNESMTTGVDLSFGGSANRIIGVNANTASGNGHNLTVQAGGANSGNNNGGDLILQGGYGTGSGAAGSVIVRPQADSTFVFRVQNAAGTDDLLIADTTNMVLTVKNLVIEDNIKLGGHFLAYDAPVATGDATASVCTGTAVTVDGTDVAGNVEITTGTGCTAGQIAEVLFGQAYETQSEPQITLTPANSAAADMKYFVDTSTENSFTVSTTNAPTDSTVYKFYYHVIQGRAPF